MSNDFFAHLQDRARYSEEQPEPQGFEPPFPCPLCGALILRTSWTAHSEWHERTEK